MTGVFVAVVGPSGAGKDTLIREARMKLGDSGGFHFVRRYVTRPSSAHEEHLSLVEEDFEAGRQAGRFALTWQAHGLSYAVPRSVTGLVASGTVAVCNLSRGALAEAATIFPRQVIVLVTAGPELLTERLSARGREDRTAILARIEREASRAPLVPDYTVVNDGTPCDGGGRLVRILEDLRRGIAPPLHSTA